MPKAQHLIVTDFELGRATLDTQFGLIFQKYFISGIINRGQSIGSGRNPDIRFIIEKIKYYDIFNIFLMEEP